MPTLSDIVSVSITRATKTPTRLGFGTPLLLRYHTEWPDLVRTYKSVTAITDDGFASTDPVVAMATAIFSQNPRPKEIKIGRRQTAFQQIIHITPKNTTVGFVYSFQIQPQGALTATTITYTVLMGDTIQLIVEALQPLVDAIAGITATEDNTKVVVTTTALGDLANYIGFDDSNDLELFDATTDPGITADLDDIEAVDPDGWYFLLLDSNSKAEINAAATWTEARKKLCVYNTTDTDCTDPASTTDIMYVLKAAAYDRTGGIFSQSELLSYSACAWVGKRAPTDPGSGTWAHKTLAGVTVDVLTGAEDNAVLDKNGSTYTTVAGINITFEGKVASGEYFDIMRFTDWLEARIKERVFGLFANSPKVSYTNKGVGMVVAQVEAQLIQGVKAGGLNGEGSPPFLVTAPKVEDIDAADKANRHLPDVEFTATYAGAIHKTTITGTISV